VRQIACGDTSSFAVAVDGRLLLWGTLPLHDKGICPVQRHPGAGDWHGADDDKVLWPCFMGRQPPGYVTLPTMGGSTRALVMLCTLPPLHISQESDRGDGRECLNERENSHRLANVQQDLPTAGGCKRKCLQEGVGPGGYMWVRRLR
jgi:hypothetical protein